MDKGTELDSEVLAKGTKCFREFLRGKLSPNTEWEGLGYSVNGKEEMIVFAESRKGSSGMLEDAHSAEDGTLHTSQRRAALPSGGMPALLPCKEHFSL